jgi:3-oxoacyl-[acyl-carrier protein] reductase
LRKTAIVTGASRGIGRTIALGLAADGFGVVMNYAGNAANAEEVVNEITSAGGHALATFLLTKAPEGCHIVTEEAVKGPGAVQFRVQQANAMHEGISFG